MSGANWTRGRDGRLSSCDGGGYELIEAAQAPASTGSGSPSGSGRLSVELMGACSSRMSSSVDRGSESGFVVLLLRLNENVALVGVRTRLRDSSLVADVALPATDGGPVDLLRARLSDGAGAWPFGGGSVKPNGGGMSGWVKSKWMEDPQ